MVVPFFGDQPFWGAMTARAGAGPDPVPFKHLISDSLAEAILKALTPEALEKARKLGEKVSREKGADKLRNHTSSPLASQRDLSTTRSPTRTSAR